MRRSGPLVKRLRRFLRARDGNVLIFLAAGMGVMAGVAGLAIDMGNAYVLRGRLQATADAAALAAVSQLPDESLARSQALTYADLNMPSGKHGTVLAGTDVVAGRWVTGAHSFTPGGTPVNAVRVVARRSRDNGNAAPTFFARLMGFKSIDIDASAVALSGTGICILALDPSMDDAFAVSNRTYTTKDCSVYVNSSSSTALSGSSQGVVDSEAICVGGGYDGAPSYTPSPDTGCAAVRDPLDYLAAPTVGPCDETNYIMPSAGDTIDPGVYCGGIRVNANATLTMNPGTYIIKDGAFDVIGGSDVIGDGVHLYLTGSGAELNLIGASQIDLTAPTTGDMAGILVYADRNMDPTLEHTLRGGADALYEGVVYMPSTGLRFTGNTTGVTTASWTAYIARHFSSAGSGDLVVNYVPGGSSLPLPVGLGSGRLVQ